VAVQAGHHDVGQEQVDRLAGFLRDPPGLLRVASFQDPVSLGREHVPCDGADVRLIVNQQDRVHCLTSSSSGADT
jgi:hypothetical protein